MRPSPVLLDVARSGFVESRHRGSLVLLDAGGAIEIAAGEPEVAVFARSALKPLQATAMVQAGFTGSADALALSAASHDGARVHVDGVRAMLAAAGLDEAALQCPPALPSGRDAMLAHVAAGGLAARICHSCSGKHAAMLATCRAGGWDVTAYREPTHPLQQAIEQTITRLCAEPIAASGVDGCGAPAHAVSLVGLARAFGSIATAGAGTAAAEIRDAMRAAPVLIGGAGRAVSDFTAAVDGLLCKDGAEGIWGAALTDGRAFAVKVDDGADRAQPPLLAAALRYWGVGPDAVARWSSMPVLGGGETVGEIRWSAELRDLLGL